MPEKQTNPKDALGIEKAPTHLVPTAPLYELGLAMLEGGRKYGAHNFRDAGTRASVYYDAARRHIDAWWEGEDVDPDSGIHHLMKAAACLFVMRDSQFMGNDVDDRPIRYPDGLNLKRFNNQVKKIINKYPYCKEPFTEKAKNDVTEQLEEYKHFVIRKERTGKRGWYAMMVTNNRNRLFLHKDLTVNSSTSYNNLYGYGKAPGYYKDKEEAKKYVDMFYSGDRN